MNTKLLAFSLVWLLGVSASGCAASTEDATIEVGVASESSALQAEAPATPDPGATAAETSAAPAGARVRLRVKEVRVHVAGDDDGAKGNGNGNGAKADDATDDGKSGGNGWVTIFTGDRTIELNHDVALDSLLGSARARAGRLTQVRLVLDGQATLVDGTTETPIACGSCETSGLKIIPKGNTRLESGGTHHFVIAFDIAKSIVDEGGQLRLKPVLRLALRN